jgi:hypothetical protein
VSAPRFRRAALAAVLVLAVAAPASAFLPDPYTIAILQGIDTALETWMDTAIRDFDLAQTAIFNRYRIFTYPKHLFDPIIKSIDIVQATRADLGQMACGWHFSNRTAFLAQLYFDPTLHLCRPQMTAIWGESQGLWDSDLQEMQLKTATLTQNVLQDRANSDDTFSRIPPQDFKTLGTVWKSPGEATRHEAKLLAMAGQIGLANLTLRSQLGQARTMDQAMDTYYERAQKEFNLAVLDAVAQSAPHSGEATR